MGKVVGYVYGQNYVRRYKLNASMLTRGVPTLMGAAASGANVGPCTATAAANAIGLSVGTGTYSTTQGDAEGTIEVDINPGCIIECTATGAAAEGTALTVHTNTAAETAGTTLTASTLASVDMDGGTVWRYSNGCGGESRTITTFSTSTSLVVTVPFTQDIVLNDTFLVVPWNEAGDAVASGGDGTQAINLSTLLTQARADIVTGTGIAAQIVELVLRGTTDTVVQFVLRDHVFGTAT